MDEIISVKFPKNLGEDNCEYFFTLLGERFFYLNNLWIKELEKKFNKKFKPIFVLNSKRNKFFKMGSYIIINKRLSNLQNKIGNKKIVFQSELEDFNQEFSRSKLVENIINELALKQKRVFILSWTTSKLFLKNQKAVILGPKPAVATKYDNKIEHVKLFQKLNLPRNKTKIYNKLSELEKISKTAFPLFLSASFSSGGHESRVFKSLTELKSFYPQFREINRSNKFLVADLIQDIISSPNSSAIVAGNNKTDIICISDQILHGTKYLGNIYPAKLSEKNRKNVVESTKKIGDYLSQQGFRGLFGCDFLIDSKNNCYITDLNPRRQGGYLCNVLMLLSKGVNIIEAELKLALGEKIAPIDSTVLGVEYCWAHSKINPPPNYKIISSLKSGRPSDPFSNIGSVFKMTFFPEKYLYVSGTAGYCIASDYSRTKAEKRVKNTLKEVNIKSFVQNKSLPKNYFDQIEILDILK